MFKTVDKVIHWINDLSSGQRMSTRWIRLFKKFPLTKYVLSLRTFVQSNLVRIQSLSNMFWVGLVVFTFNFKNMSNSWDWLNRTIYACADCPYILQMCQSSSHPETYSGKQINMFNIRLINVYMTIFFSTFVILNFQKSTTFTVNN